MCKFERDSGAREIYPSLDQINKVRSKTSKGFSGRNQMISKKKKKVFTEIARDFPAEIRILSGFSNTCSPKKKKGFHPKNFIKSGVSSQKTLIWISICAPEATSLLTSSGHSPRLGGHKQSVGGHGRGLPPVAPGLVARNL